MHQRDQPAAAYEGGCEGQAVDDVDHRIRTATGAGEQVGQPVQVHRQPAAAPDDPVPVTHGHVGRARMLRTEHRDLVAAAGQSRGDLLDVHLGTAAVGVRGVAPGQEEDLHLRSMALCRAIRAHNGGVRPRSGVRRSPEPGTVVGTVTSSSTVPIRETQSVYHSWIGT